MTCYIVTFDLVDASDFSAVQTALKATSAYCPIHDRCWAVITGETSAKLCERIYAEIKGGGRVFVVRSGTDAAWINTYGEENSSWLKKNL